MKKYLSNSILLLGAFQYITISCNIEQPVQERGNNQKNNYHGNELKTIYPYKHEKRWVFDDKHLDLKAEPFVRGASVLIDKMLESRTIQHTEKGIEIIASDKEIPGHHFLCTKVKDGTGEDKGWTFYTCTIKDNSYGAWLCPAFYRFFKKPPDHLYLLLEENSSTQ